MENKNKKYIVDFTSQIKLLEAGKVFYYTWENKNPKKTAETYVKVFGPPDEIGKSYAKWDNIADFGGPTIIKDEEIAHDHPVEHIDFVYSTKQIRVTAEQVGVLAKCSGSIIVDQLKEEVTARCHYLIKNAVTLGFVEDVVTEGFLAALDKTPRQEYAKRIKTNITPDWYNDPLNEYKKTLIVDVKHHLQINK